MTIGDGHDERGAGAGAGQAGEGVLVAGGALDIATLDDGFGTLSYNAALNIADGGVIFRDGATITTIDNTVSPGVANPTPVDPATIRSLIKTAALAGYANTTGITSTAAASDSSLAIGYASGAAVSSVAGTPLAAGDVALLLTSKGDANLDGSVNGIDATALISGWGTGGKVWTQGDFNYDDDVNGIDATALISNWTGDPGPAPESSVVVEYDVTTGEIIVSANGVINWSVESASGGLSGETPNFGALPGLPTDTPAYIGLSTIFSPQNFTDQSLGLVAAPGLQDLQVFYQTQLGQTPIAGTLVVVPEPMTLSVLAIGGLLAIRRRRRKV